jgi:hypothetical protein
MLLLLLLLLTVLVLVMLLLWPVPCWGQLPLLLAPPPLLLLLLPLPCRVACWLALRGLKLLSSCSMRELALLLLWASVLHSKDVT